MIKFVQQLINGISIGFVYALIAIGYSLIYSILSFSNFAHSTFIIAGAYVGFYFLVIMALPLPLALLGAILGGALVATIAEKAAYKPIREKGNPTLYFIIASMGMSIFGENIVIATIGAKFRSYPQILPVTAVNIGALSVSLLDVFAALVGSLFLLILLYIINKTKEGMAIRAASYDLETVGLMGVNTSRLICFVFIVAGALAGLAGFFLGTKYTVYPQLGALTTKAYVAAVFGGLGSLAGAVVGSVLLGIMETMIAGYLSSTIRDIVVFALLIVILLVRPSGLLGVAREEKV
ncbi:MAG: branched-chain amino acid ABC transporter permease [Peptococcaceae bacterium]|nr:branched-chain amino acid ABC transporter permease [Peptococcaceae bacterium]